MPTSTENKFDNPTAYEQYVGRWSRKIGKDFITWLDVPAQNVWLDVGSGTGIVSNLILQQTDPAKVVGVDISHTFVELAKERVRDSRAQFYVGDANTLDFSDSFDVAIAALVLNFVASPQQVVANMARLVKSGGMVAAYVWDYADKMEMMRHFWTAAIALDPAAAELDSAKVFTICSPDNLTALFKDAGLKDVEVTSIDIQTVFNDFDDYWQPFLDAQGSVSKYLRSLNDEKRAAISQQLQQQLPFEKDGTIPLIARAQAVKGVTP